MSFRSGPPAALAIFGLTLAALSFPLAAGPAASRSRVLSSESLADDSARVPLGPLRLHWVRDTLPLLPAWPDQPRMRFDHAARPVVANGTVFLNSSRTDSVTAYHLDTGTEKWRFITDGPVRFPAAVWNGHVYFTSDDGHLYCLDAANGELLWKFRGGPSERRVLGNERLICTWPARGAPVVVEEAARSTGADSKATIYFAAGIWPFMGIFLHAVDARTGRVVWTNDGDGSRYIKQPHQTDAFAGVAPQGQLVVSGDRLLIPGGRSVPACYDRHTGKLLHFHLADNSKLGGGSEVQATATVFVNGGAVFDLVTGYHLGPTGEPALLVGGRLHAYSGGELKTWDISGPRRITVPDGKKQKTGKATWQPKLLGAVAVPKVEALADGGSRLFAASAGRVFALNLPLQRGARPSWEAKIEGRPFHLVTAGGRLFVSTREGRLYCFGSDSGEEPCRHPLPEKPAVPRDEWTDRAHELLERTGVRAGYCIAWGAGSGRLVTELVRQSQLHVIVFEPDCERADALRKELIDARLYGERVAVVNARATAATLPPYLASLMVSEDLATAGVVADRDWLGKAFASLRPFGGIACLPIAAGERSAFREAVVALGDEARLREAGSWMLLERPGALPGAADWTHEHADAANTRVSRDQRVKAPLGLLWFGGPAHDPILPRHGHGPQPQVVGGRLLIEGRDLLRAVDIYTGRLLWEAPLPGLGAAYDNSFNNYAHQPGANASGSNYASATNGIYVAHERACVRLDPATGKEIARFHLPPFPGEKQAPTWEYVSVAGDYLIAGANPTPKEASKRPVRLSSSRLLAVLDRHQGTVLWTATAKLGFRHNSVCAGGGRLYAIDRTSSDQSGNSKSKDEQSLVKPRLLALDLKTGRRLWTANANVFGTWLSYSDKRDVLIESGRVTRDTLYDEPKGMRAYRAGNGKVLWFREKYAGPAMIHGDLILKEGGACDLLTGAPTMRTDPLTGQRIEWTWCRTYGCNTPMASEHLLTFRSGAAGYFDLANDGGTGNFGGFRSSCTNNLVVAGGVLVAPDYTRTCTCSYQNQTSVALVPTADAEMWTYYGAREVKGPVRQAGVLLGAPGNRKADDGTLWLEYPTAGGPSPRLSVRTVPAAPEYFRHHSSQIDGPVPGWLAASGARGLRSLSVALVPDGRERQYTVRLYFVEPERLPAGKRQFHVALQGKPVLADLDVSQEAGGPGRGLMREFKGVKVRGDLTVTLTPASSSPSQAPVLCGVEVIAEGW